MEPPIDPRSPVPLYFQIAEALRRRIEAGELAAGEALIPMREAAERWGVNLHTVRHAYTALARQGLVESQGSRGTRVLLAGPKPRRAAKRAGAARPSRGLDAFLDSIARKASRAHGLSPGDLAAAIVRRCGPTAAALPRVHVVECSAWQCECHARELRAAWRVDARPWPLEQEGEPPEGDIVATYFHYNDIRRRWPHRLREVRFITIAPESRLAERLSALARERGPLRILVCDQDEPTAQNIASDLSLLLPEGSDPAGILVTADPREAIERCERDDAWALLPPRMWDRLRARDRRHPRALEVRYAFDRAELAALGRELGWHLGAA